MEQNEQLMMQAIQQEMANPEVLSAVLQALNESETGKQIAAYLIQTAQAAVNPQEEEEDTTTSAQGGQTIMQQSGGKIEYLANKYKKGGKVAYAKKGKKNTTPTEPEREYGRPGVPGSAKEEIVAPGDTIRTVSYPHGWVVDADGASDITENGDNYVPERVVTQRDYPSGGKSYNVEVTGQNGDWSRNKWLLDPVAWEAYKKTHPKLSGNGIIAMFSRKLGFSPYRVSSTGAKQLMNGYNYYLNENKK